MIINASGEDISHAKTKTDFLDIKDSEAVKLNLAITSDSVSDLSNYDFNGANKAIYFSDAHSNVEFEGGNIADIQNLYTTGLILDKNVRDFGSSVNGNNWYIVGTGKKENEVAGSIISDTAANYLNASLRLEMDTLHKRLGEIREYKQEDGAWGRVIGGDIDAKAYNFDLGYKIIQAGYDKNYENDDANFFSGFALGYTNSDMDYTYGNGDSKSLSLSLYESIVSKNDAYLDLVLKYAHSNTKFDISNQINQKMDAKYNTNSLSASLELGKRYENDKGYFITPHIRLGYTYINDIKYTTSSNVKTNIDSLDSIIGKVGVYIGKEFDEQNHYIKLAALKEFSDSYDIDMQGKDARLHKSIYLKDDWYEVGLGGDMKIKDKTFLYYSLDRTFKSMFETKWQGILGFRREF